LTVVDRLSALTPEQRALFEALRRKQQTAGPPSPPPVSRVTSATAAGDWPLSIDQERLWRLHRDNPGLVSWNVDATSRLRGDLDVAALERALQEVVRRHAVLRASFPLVDGRPVQRVAERIAVPWALIDVSALPAEHREAEGLRALFDRTRAVFDLERGPLVRATLVRLDPGDHFCLLTLHHTVTDWITFQVVMQELMVLYDAARSGVASPLPEPGLQFPDYAVWEQQWWSGEILTDYTEFWRRELAGFPLVLDLPGDRPRPAVQSQRGGMIPFSTGPEAAHRLRALARREGVTPFMALLALVDALLFRLTGRDKLVVGSNSANRPRPELEAVAGFFLTQVPFPVDLGGDPTFRELLARVKKASVLAYSHQNMPFDQLVKTALGIAPDPSRFPVVQVLLLVLEGQSHTSASSLDSAAVPLYDGNSRWDLLFGLYNYEDLGFSGSVEFNADILDEATVERWLALFRCILDRVTAEPEIRLSQLPGLAEVAA
jgi:Condensation domain